MYFILFEDVESKMIFCGVLFCPLQKVWIFPANLNPQQPRGGKSTLFTMYFLRGGRSGCRRPKTNV